MGRLDGTLPRRLARRAFVAKAANAVEALRLKLTALYERLSDRATRALLADVLARLADAPDEAAALDLLRGLNLADAALTAIPAADLNDLNEALYLAGALDGAGKWLKFSLGAPDYRALELIGQQQYFWLREHYSRDVQAGFEGLLNQAYAEGWSRDRLAEAMQQQFRELAPASRAYFNGLADHTTRKLREIGRVAGYERAGITQVKVQAILDARTSAICRCMNGRIIPVATLAAQKERILSARSREELQQAQPWLTNLTAVSDLPANYGLPPYHYRCRTVTVAYFPELSEVGKPVQWSDDAGKPFVGDKIVASHVDEKLGRELLLSERGLRHANNEARHPIARQKLEAALRSIERKGLSDGTRGRAQELVTLSKNHAVLFFRNNLIYNAYQFQNAAEARKAFDKLSQQGQRKGNDHEPEC